MTLPITRMTTERIVRMAPRKSAQQLEGVQEAMVNLATEKATVRFDPSLVGRDQFRTAVEHAGCGLGPIPEEAVSPAVTGAAKQPLSRS